MTNAAFMMQAMEEGRAAVRAGAPIQVRAAAAHAAHESAFGRSGLATSARNLFGVKAVGQHTPFWDGDSVTMPTWEVVDGQNVRVDAPFRAYPSWAASFGDYGDVIRRVYPSSAESTHDIPFLSGLFLAGPRKWATDPLIFERVARILGGYSHMLYAPDAPVDDGDLRFAETVVVHDLMWGDRLTVLMTGGDEAVLRGHFGYRVRGGKLDVRRVS